MGAQTLGLSGFYDQLPPHSILPYLYLLSVFRIPLSRPGNAFNSRLHLTPGCLPTPLRSPGTLEGGREVKGANSPWTSMWVLRRPCPACLFDSGQSQLRAPAELPGSLQVLQPEGHPAGAQQPPTGWSAPWRRLHSPGSPGAWPHLRLCCDRLAAVLCRGADVGSAAQQAFL